ncbi:hypothetical protein ACXET9_14395 [Brachybacterium sp. DNPG3]
MDDTGDGVSAPQDPLDTIPDPPADAVPEHTPSPRMTTARAVLRPVPDGFPSPPPAPLRRRPDAPAPTAVASRRTRGPLVAALSVAAALVLAAGIGGGVLAYRLLAPSSDASVPDAGAPGTSEEADAASDGTRRDGATAAAGTAATSVRIGDVTVREISVETGLASVGEGSGEVTAQGELVVVTVEVANRGLEPAVLHDPLRLVTADGDVHDADPIAGDALDSPTRTHGTVAEGSSDSFHAVFDIDPGAVPVAVQVDLGSAIGEGTLELAP